MIVIIHLNYQKKMDILKMIVQVNTIFKPNFFKFFFLLFYFFILFYLKGFDNNMVLQNTNFNTFSLIYEENNLIILNTKENKCECRNCLIF